MSRLFNNRHVMLVMILSAILLNFESGGFFSLAQEEATTEISTETQIPVSPQSPTNTSTPTPTSPPSEPSPLTETPTSIETPTETPTVATSEPTMETVTATPLESPAEPPSVTPSLEPSATLTEERLPTEPYLIQVLADTFDSGGSSWWTLGTSWSFVPTEGGQALQVSTSDEAATFVYDNLFNVAAQARFSFTTGSARIRVRESVAGSYTASMDINGLVSLYRGDTLMASSVAISGGQWSVLRLSAIDGVLRVAVDGVEVIAVRDNAQLPPGLVSLLGSGLDSSVLLVDDFELWMPDGELPITSTPVETATETATATATPDEPALSLLFADNFNSGEALNWLLRAGWAVIPSESGSALAVSNSAEAATFGLGSYADVAVQANFLLNTGSAQISVHQSEDGAYTAILRADGQVFLYRGQALFSSAAIQLSEGWHTLRLYAVQGVLRVSVDGNVVIDTTDSAPLPPGEISIVGPGTIAPAESDEGVSTLLVDDFELWVLATDVLADVGAQAITYIGDRVWNDLDYDGIQDVGEPGVAGVTVRLYRSNNSLVATTTTNANGFYNFSRDLPGGNYYIQIILPVGFDFTAQLQGSSTFSDSDVDPFTGKTRVYFLNNGSTYTTIDAGLAQLYDCDAVIEIMLVFDGSGSIDNTQFSSFQAFARGLANSFNIRSTSARMGIVQFGAEGYGRVHTTLSGNASSVRGTIQKIPRLTGAALSFTDIQEGVQLAQQEIDRNGRPAPVPRAIIVLTDGYHNTSGSDPILEASLAKGKGTVIYVVAIGSYSTLYVNGIASDPDSQHVFPVSGLQQIVQALYTLTNATCGTPVRPVAPTLREPANNALTNDNTPTFRWDLAANATQYQIQIDNNSNFSSPERVATITNLTYTPIAPLADGRWYWRVRGLNGSVPGAWSTTSRYFTVDTIPPAAPLLTRPSDKAGVSDTRPSFSWRASATANHYRIEVSTDNTFASPLFSVTTASLSYRLPTAQPLGRYYWRVQARDAAGNWSAWSDVWSFDITIMRAPSNGSWTIDTTPTFQWNRLTGAAGYELEVAINPDFDLANIVIKWASLNATSYTVPNTSSLPYGIYYWRVNIDMGTGTFEPSPVYWVLTVTPKPLAAPKLLTPLNNAFLNDNTPDFGWEAVTDGMTYQIQISTTSNFALPVQDVVVNDLAYTAATLLNSKYYWRVRALNYLNVPGSWSAARIFTIDTVAPPVPVLSAPFSASTTTDTTPTFRWNRTTGAANYEMQLDTTTPRYTVYIGAGTSYTPSSPLLRNRWYYWRVRSIDAAGNVSAWSPLWYVYISSPTNDAPVLNRYLTSSPTLTWVLVTWATEYELEIDDDSRFRSPNYRSGLIASSNLSHTILTALPNGTWYWRIRARDSSGNYGNWSNTGTFTVEA